MTHPIDTTSVMLGEHARLRALQCAASVAACDGPAEAAARIEACVAGVCACDRVRCVFHDSDAGAWWCERDGDVEITAARGVVSQVTRSRTALHVVTAADADGFELSVDDPGARGELTLLAAPVTDARDRVHAVLVVTRDGTAPFSADEVRWLDAFAGALTPALSLLESRIECETEVRAERGYGGFRSEAVDVRTTGRNSHGTILRVTPVWLRACYWALFVVAMLTVVGGLTVEVNRYAQGAALVIVPDRRSISVEEAGTLAALLVSPGESVRRGQRLAQLDDVEQREQVDALRLRLAAELRRRLRSPNDTTSAAAIAQLNLELSLAEHRAGRQTIRAPADGVVGDIRVKLGDSVGAGDELLTLLAGEEMPQVIALLPGEERGRLHAGQEVTLDLAEAGGEQLHVVLTSVGDEVIGPAEARRFLGTAHADALELGGPVVIATASLPSARYPTDRGELELHDGMRATARVRVQRETIFESLLSRGPR